METDLPLVVLYAKNDRNRTWIEQISRTDSRTDSYDILLLVRKLKICQQWWFRAAIIAPIFFYSVNAVFSAEYKIKLK